MNKLLKRLSILLVLLALIALPMAASASGSVKVNGTTYSTLKEAVEANKNVTSPVTMEISGEVTWETGAQHGSTPFDMKTSKLTLKGVTSDATFTATGAGVGPVGMADGKVVFENLKIKDESVSYAESSWEFGYLEFRGKLEFNNCDFVNAIQLVSEGGTGPNAQFNNCTFNSNASGEYDVWVCDGYATFTKCEFYGYRGLKIHEAYGSDVKNVLIDKCVFGELSVKPGVAIGDVNSNTTIQISDSYIVSCQPGDQGKFIYESDTDTTNFSFIVDNNTITDEYPVFEDVGIVPPAGALGNMPSTGDESNMMLFVLLLAVSAMSMLALRKRSDAR